ncbi:MAG: copper chaperone PCu(A)C [Chloroflexi bacterium]|nr:copper chaperone PCu(A)C [Chloroflexota bacterium]
MKKSMVFVILAVLLLAACVPSGGVSIEGAWGRSVPQATMNSAFYMTIRNPGAQADQLTAVKTSACAMTELHESFMGADGVMGMRPVTGGKIEVPAGGSVELKAGGLHVMCMSKKVALDPGVKVQATLTFAKAGDKTIDIEIR